MEAENYFEALVDEACKETAKDETWMKIYGHQYQDLLIINLDNRKVSGFCSEVSHTREERKFRLGAARSDNGSAN